MTKLGTPIGAGPKGAIVVVGLAIVGAPPAVNWAPPFEPSGLGRGWLPPPLAPGAVVPPPEPVPGAASSSLRRPPLLPPPAELPSISLPCLMAPPELPSFSGPGGAGAGTASPSVASAGGVAGGISVVSSGDSQSGSSMSTSPSLSSSRPLEQAGACSEGIAVVVVGLTALLSDSGSAPASAAPTAVTARKAAR